MITFYNRTKIGVDLSDQLCRKYNVSHNCRRWPLVILYDLLNIACINGVCVYSANRNYTKVVRSDFIENVVWDLIKPQIERRSTISQLPVALKHRARLLLKRLPYVREVRGQALKGVVIYVDELEIKVQDAFVKNVVTRSVQIKYFLLMFKPATHYSLMRRFDALMHESSHSVDDAVRLCDVLCGDSASCRFFGEPSKEMMHESANRRIVLFDDSSCRCVDMPMPIRHYPV
nr:unnamed protein product [Callosobruchus analis]